MPAEVGTRPKKGGNGGNGGYSPDCDRTFTLDLFDFLCFVNAFNQGC